MAARYRGHFVYTITYNYNRTLEGSGVTAVTIEIQVVSSGINIPVKNHKEINFINY